MTDLGDAIIQVADKLGIVGSDITNIVAEAQLKLAIIDFCCWGLCLIITGIFAYYFYKYISKKEDAFGSIFLTTMVSAIIFLIILSILGAIEEILLILICPEYMALEKTIELFSGLI